VLGGEGDRGQHRLVAQLGQEKGAADREQRCDLSPNSATKITPKLIARAARNPSTKSSRDNYTGQDVRDDLDPAICQSRRSRSPHRRRSDGRAPPRRASMSTITLGATPLRAINLASRRGLMEPDVIDNTSAISAGRIRFRHVLGLAGLAEEAFDQPGFAWPGGE
jgi:hypothetical protein